MLGKIREITKIKWVQWTLLGLISFSFLFWGISSYLTSGARGEVARVNGKAITLREFENYYRLQVQNSELSKLSPNEVKEINLPEILLQQLVQQRLLQAVADDLGIIVTKETIANSITDNPLFRDEKTGQFSKDKYLQFLNSARISENSVIRSTELNLRAEWIQNILRNVTLSLPLLTGALAESYGTKVNVRYGALVVAKEIKLDKPDVNSLEKFYQNNLVLYNLPNYRSFQYVALSEKDVTNLIEKGISVSESEIGNLYQSRQEQWVIPPSFELEQLLFNDRAAAENLSNQINGQTVGGVLRQSLKNYQIAGVAYSQLNNLTINDLANYGFNSNSSVGVVSRVLENNFGFALVRLVAKSGGGKKTLAEVRPNIVAELRAEKRNKALDEFYKKLIDDLASGQKLSEVINKLKIPVTVVNTPLIDNKGQDKDGKLWVNKWSKEILDKGFVDNILNRPIFILTPPEKPDTLLLLAVNNNEVAGILPYDKVSNKVSRDWQAQQMQAWLNTEIAKWQKEITAGKFNPAQDNKLQTVRFNRTQFSLRELLSRNNVVAGVANQQLFEILQNQLQLNKGQDHWVMVTAGTASAPELIFIQLEQVVKPTSVNPKDLAEAEKNMDLALKRTLEQAIIKDWYSRYKVKLFPKNLANLQQ